jgi:hypothetical protein
MSDAPRILLANAELEVELLDPNAADGLQGTRYCWGGYIWQVLDRSRGPLLSGPQFPLPRPDPFNGQGLPESFRFRTRDGLPLTWDGSKGYVIGAGTIAAADGGVRLVQPLAWTVRREPHRLVFEARSDDAAGGYHLLREVTLSGRSLHSHTRLTHLGPQSLSLEWFAHPFFALTDGLIEVRLPSGTRLAENPGFSLVDSVLRPKRRFAHERDGHMDFLSLPPGQPLRCRTNHPTLPHLDFETDFVPSECIVWGNSATFSVEPYLARTLAPGETSVWSLRYQFGESDLRTA